MAAKRKDYEDLIKPEAPGAIDKTAVNNAAQGVTAAKSAFDSMSYDNFKQGSMYDGLKKSYEQQGQRAMKDTIGQVAARTGGMASSWAASAGQQSYNNYMQQLEDVARSMYNDEYSRAHDKVMLAQGEYDRAYGEYRDSYDDAWDAYDRDMQAYRYAVDDQRYDAEQSQKLQEKEENRVYSDAYHGNAPTYADYKAAGGTLDERTYNSLVATAQGQYKDDNFERNKAAADEEMNGIAGDIEARIANGESLEDIAEAYGIENDAGWKAATGMTKAQWQAFSNDNEVKGYKYANTTDGANAIVNSLTKSATLSLSEKDQKNFDYIYGDGAYEAVQQFITNMELGDGNTGFGHPDQMSQRLFEQRFNYLFDSLASKVPGLTSDQIFALIEKVNPAAFTAATTNNYWSGRRSSPVG